MAALPWYKIFLAAGMLITGSINTLSKKAQNDCSAKGLKDMSGNAYHSFDHPWFQTLIMFCGETLCLIGLIYHRRKVRMAAQEEMLVDPLGAPQTSEVSSNQRVCQLIFMLPTVCDLFGTTLSGIGLLYVDASIWQMLRGSIIVFTGVFSKIFLKRDLKATHWIGMGTAMLGLLLVGLSTILRQNHTVSQWHTILGVILIVSSQIVSATQMVIEETFLKKRNFHPLHVVGMEGFYGIIFMVALVLPVVYFIPGNQHHNSYENSIDALIMIRNNPKLAVFCVLYLASIAFYNFFGLSVTKSLTAVHRTLLDACRTLVVWVVSLFIYYAIDETFGEVWNKTYGMFQVDGFMLLLIGTAMYNQLIDLSWIRCFRQSSSYPVIQAPDYQIEKDERRSLLSTKSYSAYDSPSPQVI
ncbi:solute carrier family 35 member F6-like [Rhopilema esculentum]|uniref:solute carrier family 35 member F6-like n=1 Tax=Rhopilema esculentum TaxID=499914 RepID=UPI0031D68A18